MFGDSSREFSFIELSDLPFLFFFHGKANKFSRCISFMFEAEGPGKWTFPIPIICHVFAVVFWEHNVDLGCFSQQDLGVWRSQQPHPVVLYLFCLGAFS